ncbi:MAG TPA: glycosyltransferase family 4 protein [Bacteroidia bacterium]|jgi:glycosyltransferase involved in cell wall biosynthesis|nr:glycosyltransferase family 4 protein [Bacteroidia bacterium]
MKKKILFVAPHRKGRAPSQRFRFEQYLDVLKENGFEWEFSELLDEADDKVFYSSGNFLSKIRTFFKGRRKRKADVRRANDFDIIFIQREAFMTGETWIEKAFADSKAKVIYDFDDAIWMLDVSKGNRIFSWMKDPKKTSELIAMSDLVFAGNQYLADYAKKFNPKVEIVPTTIDTSLYKRVETQKRDRVIIGWSGSLTTIKHFEHALEFLKNIKRKFGDRVAFKVIGDERYVNEELGIKGIRWTEQDEVKELSSFDIGIMPLPDDEWAKGKCGLKGLQYMALGIPTIMSPVGVNTEIIRDGENGFLAKTDDEWTYKLSLLIENADLRKRIGEEAVKAVEEKYSVNAWKGRYVELFSDL